MKYFDFLTDVQKRDFALFLKRTGFSAVLETTTGSNDKDEAQKFIEAIELVREKLAKEETLSR